MSEYIKREDAYKAFRRVLDEDFPYISEETPRERITAIPSADVVEVVRCKDCKWSEVKPYGCETDLICTCQDVWWALTGDTEGIDEIEVEENHYCSYGERKDGDEE